MSAYRAGWFLIPAPIIGCSVLGIATSTALRNHVAISEVPDAYSRTATEGDLFLGDAYLAVGSGLRTIPNTSKWDCTGSARSRKSRDPLRVQRYLLFARFRVLRYRR